jgi:hypothetical protein
MMGFNPNRGHPISVEHGPAPTVRRSHARSIRGWTISTTQTHYWLTANCATRILGENHRSRTLTGRASGGHHILGPGIGYFSSTPTRRARVVCQVAPCGQRDTAGAVRTPPPAPPAPRRPHRDRRPAAPHPTGSAGRARPPQTEQSGAPHSHQRGGHTSGHRMRASAGC